MEELIKYYDKFVNNISNNKDCPKNVEDLLIIGDLDLDNIKILCIVEKYSDLPEEDNELIQRSFPGLYYISVEPFESKSNEKYNNVYLRAHFPLLIKLISILHSEKSDIIFITKGQLSKRLFDDFKKIDDKIISLEMFELVYPLNDKRIKQIKQKVRNIFN